METLGEAFHDWRERTILIGEDEMVNLKLLEMILLKTKVKVLHGRNGQEVIQLFESNPDVSLILMDIKMPDMDGIEAAQAIRKIHSSVPIIAQTAYALEDEKNRCFEAGFNDYITKPINRKQLLSLIESYFS
ncbi:MAG TPA: response regulator [Bacteroidales bacterium]|nr:response regulator [Bacteroidales bacterium]